MTKIVLVNFPATKIRPDELKACAIALETQIKTQFAMPQPVGWGISCEYVRAASNEKDIRSDEWPCLFMAEADQPGALGYHDKTPSGKPIMKCFPLLDKADGVPWQPTASHELLETLLDAELNLCFQASNGIIWAGENCDAVEADTYDVMGVPLSNWCTPLWFSNVQVGRFDWMSLCKKPFEIRKGGYGQIWKADYGWKQVVHSDKAPRSYRLAHIGRGMKRVASHVKVIP